MRNKFMIILICFFVQPFSPTNNNTTNKKAITYFSVFGFILTRFAKSYHIELFVFEVPFMEPVSVVLVCEYLHDL